RTGRGGSSTASRLQAASEARCWPAVEVLAEPVWPTAPTTAGVGPACWPTAQQGPMLAWSVWPTALNSCRCWPGLLANSRTGTDVGPVCLANSPTGTMLARSVWPTAPIATGVGLTLCRPTAAAVGSLLGAASSPNRLLATQQRAFGRQDIAPEKLPAWAP